MLIGFHFGMLGDRVRDQVGGQPQRRGRRERVGPAGEVLLDDVVLRGAGQLGAHVGRGRRRPASTAGLLERCRLVEREQPHRRRVDRHRGVHLGQRDAVEQRPHVAEVADRHADLADLAAGQLVVGVVAGLGRQVEGDRQPGLALGQVAPVERVGLGRRGVPGVRPHHPRLVPHGHGSYSAGNLGPGRASGRVGRGGQTAGWSARRVEREDPVQPGDPQDRRTPGLASRSTSGGRLLGPPVGAEQDARGRWRRPARRRAGRRPGRRRRRRAPRAARRGPRTRLLHVQPPGQRELMPVRDARRPSGHPLVLLSKTRERRGWLPRSCAYRRVRPGLDDRRADHAVTPVTL